jgi:prephenate dehydratase
MIPVENSRAGRVADIHHLLPERDLRIVAEHFQPVVHHLLAVPGARLEDIVSASSHVQALSQCRNFMREHNFEARVHADTAGAAADVAAQGDPKCAAIASTLAADIYGLHVLQSAVQDTSDNTTRFCVLAPKSPIPPNDGRPFITTLVFRLRSVPAALYKALGGFATNGVNLTKVESYILDGSFQVAQFYADIEGHPEQQSVQLALEELAFFSEEITLLGTYYAHSYRASEG